MVAIVVFFAEKRQVQINLATFLITLSLIAHAWARPFGIDVVNRLEFLSLFASFITYFFFLFLSFNDELDDLSLNIITLLIATVNILVLAVIVLYALRAFQDKFKDLASTALNKAYKLVGIKDGRKKQSRRRRRRNKVASIANSEAPTVREKKLSVSEIQNDKNNDGSVHDMMDINNETNISLTPTKPIPQRRQVSQVNDTYFNQIYDEQSNPIQISNMRQLQIPGLTGPIRSKPNSVKEMPNSESLTDSSIHSQRSNDLDASISWREKKYRIKQEMKQKYRLKARRKAEKLGIDFPDTSSDSDTSQTDSSDALARKVLANKRHRLSVTHAFEGESSPDDDIDDQSLSSS